MNAHALSVGIIGLGYGRAHIPAFQANGCRVVAVCQRDEATAKAVASRHGVPSAFTGWEAMLDEARPEIVVIATPPYLHHAIALRAFAAGAHVLCEKPLAMTRAEAQSIADAAARAGRIGMTAFNWRFTAAMRELHATMAEGGVGRVFNIAARWLGSRLADEKAAASWRQDQAQAGHGAMGDQGVHVIDLIRWSFGEFARVVVNSGVAYPERSAPGVNRPADTDDYGTVLAELASGGQLTFSVSRVAHATNDQSLEVWGTEGALRYRLVREGPRWFEGELYASRGGASFQRVAPRSPSPSFADGLRAQAVLDAVLESSRRGAWVSVDA